VGDSAASLLNFNSATNPVDNNSALSCVGGEKKDEAGAPYQRPHLLHGPCVVFSALFVMNL